MSTPRERLITEEDELSVTTKETSNHESDSRENGNHESDRLDSSNESDVEDKQLIEWIKSRRTIGNLQEPAPTHEQIRAAIDCAVTAPDHKKLRPWRFIISEGEARQQLGKHYLRRQKRKRREQVRHYRIRPVKKLPICQCARQ